MTSQRICAVPIMQLADRSLTAIAKLAPEAAMGEALSVHYSGGSSMPEDVADWLRENGIIE